MRHRTDFFTLCPACEHQVRLSLAAYLQSGRHGYTCVCTSQNCDHEWVCIQEWISRDLPEIRHAPPVAAQAAPERSGHLAGRHMIDSTHAQPARPNLLPTFQPGRVGQPAAYGAASQQEYQPANAAPAAPNFFSQNGYAVHQGHTSHGVPEAPSISAPLVPSPTATGMGSVQGQQPNPGSVPAPKVWSWERQPTQQIPAGGNPSQTHAAK